MKIEPVSDAVGAKITGLDLSRELDADAIAEIKSAWLKYQVLIFDVIKIELLPVSTQLLPQVYVKLMNQHR